MTDLFVNIAASLAKHGNIEQRYIALYAKAMEVALATGINLMTALIIGYFMGMWWHCIIFLVSFIPLRSYAGGYHAKGYVSCFFQSVFFLILILSSIKYLAMKGLMLSSIWQLFIVSAAVVILFAPLADKNRPISVKEALFFRKRTRLVIGAESVIVLILHWFRVNYSYAVIMAVILSAFALILHVCAASLQSTQESKEIGT